MEKLTEFRHAVAATFRRMKQPQVFLPAILLLVIPQVGFLGFAGRLLGMLKERGADPSNLSRSSYGQGFGFAMILLMLCVPAAISGLAAVAKAAVERDSADWRDFSGGLGTYYGKILGTYALFVVAGMIGIVPYGLSGMRTSANAMPAFILLLLEGLLLAADYLATPWIAAIALDGTGVFKSIQNAVRFAWRNPWLLVPAFASQKMTDYLVSLADVDTQAYQGLAVLSSSSLARGLLVSVIEGFMYMFFLVLYFDLYRRRIEPAEHPAEPESLEPPPDSRL